MIRVHPVLCCALLAGTVTALVPRTAFAQTDDDKKFLADISQGGYDEIALSEVAEKKATNPAVKAFAEKMVKEHREMSDSLKPFADKWGINPPVALDSDHDKELNKLNGLVGKDFDKEYMDEMVSDHTSALDAVTKEAKDTKDASFRAAVLKVKTRIAAHKNMAYDLKKKL